MIITVQQMAEHFKLLGDTTRLKIVSILHQQDMCVCHLVELLQTTQPNISQHLRKLKNAGFVKEERRSGQWIHYSLQVSQLPHIQQALQYLPSLEEEIQLKMKQMNNANIKCDLDK